MLWAVLGQFLTFGNIILKCYLYDCRRIHGNGRAQQNQNELLLYSPETENQVENVIIVLRCPRSTHLRRAIQFVTAVLSYSFYTFGTIVLASMTLIEPFEALQVVGVISANAGLGRSVGYWAISSFRKGKKAILIDVPAAHINRLEEIVGEVLHSASSSGEALL